MAYKNWKLMDKLDVAIRNDGENYRGFTGYIVEHGDKNALEKAKDWARIRNYNRDKGEYDDPIEPIVVTFDNECFTATILDSAGGSSQGGRLSFWRCMVEKDGFKFTIGVNDAILADLIKNSEIKNGKIKEELMFARKGGQPGLIHKDMDAYADATADMKHKEEMKKAKKTSKWEIGGVYSSITQTAICLGEVFDTMEEYQVDSSWSYYRRTELRKRETPLKVLAWVHISNYGNKVIPDTLEDLLNRELESNYIYFYTGKPPARAKTQQLEVKDSDMVLLDKLLKKRERDEEKSQRFVREV